MYLSILTEAGVVEMDVGKFLKKEKGLFLGAAETPVMVEGRQYYYSAPCVIDDSKGGDLGVDHGVPIASGSEITDTVFEANGDMVVRKSQIKDLKPEPLLPVAALRLIEALIRNDVDYHMRYMAEVQNMEDVIEQFLLPEVVASKIKNSVVRTILLLARPILNAVNKFIGEDDTVIHMVVRRGDTILITKHVDYRIMEYERLKREGKITEKQIANQLEAQIVDQDQVAENAKAVKHDRKKYERDAVVWRAEERLQKMLRGGQ